MATYVIGDVQGCFKSLMRLLERCRYDVAGDRLWFTGDLVNRGPRSLETLRWLYAHRSRVHAVLGNHDLHLLALAAGIPRDRKRDTLSPVLAAPDRAGLVDWLRSQPLLHADEERLMVHAGLLPGWSVEEARGRAERVSEALAGPDWGGLLAAMSKDEPDERVETAAVMTRLRMIDKRGRPAFGYAGTPEGAPKGLVPWYAVRRAPGDPFILFGHWAAAGRRLNERFAALDSGCAWGRELTAFRLEDHAVFVQRFAD